ncbi:MAG: CapA family protein [Chloroflexi bacterium]|nr:CapA family protein [Chloroflexota bacterium]
MRLLLIVVALLLQSHVVAAQNDDCNQAGSLSRETFVSNVSGLEGRFHIYLPPCYASRTETYPLLTLLHGSNADDRQWALLGFPHALEMAIQNGNGAPMIVLMPYGGAAANDNSFGPYSYDKVLLDLLTQVSARYRTNGVRAIGGISRGGFWAYHLGLRFPEQFVAIGGHSPFFDEDHVLPAYNPLALVESLSPDTRLELWLDRGTLDYAAPGVDKMHVKLQARNIPHQFVVYQDGDHSESTWSRNVGDYVAYYSNAFSPTANFNATNAQEGKDEIELWLPAAGFGALLLSIDSADLDALLAGRLDERLMLTETAAGRLAQHGFVFHEWTRIVPYDRLFYELWRNKGSYTLLPFNELQLRLRPLWLDDLPIVDQLETYPLVFDSDFANFSRDKLTRITLSGTTALARHTLPAIDAIGLEQAVSGIREYVQLSDYFQITNEASIVPACPDAGIGLPGRDYSLCMKPEHAKLFELLDVDVVDLTGNHINDFRFEPLRQTLDVFERMGIAVVGGGRSLEEARAPLILDHNGSRIGWLACNWIGPNFALASDNPNSSYGVRPGGASCDPSWLRESLALLAAEVDLVLLTVQYREYEKFKPEHSQVIDFKTFAEWGADVVIGTAEHKPMTFEFYPTQRGETALIHYGLGNLFFDQLGWGNQRFFLDTLYIYDGRLLSVEVYPGIIEKRARPRLLTGEDRFNFLHFMFIQNNEF